jgi:hypothetical protein
MELFPKYLVFLDVSIEKGWDFEWITKAATTPMIFDLNPG